MSIFAVLSGRAAWRGPRRWCACVALAVWWLAWAGAASPVLAASVPFQAAVWIDPSGHANLMQAQRQTFVPVSNTLSLGYTASASWWRITLAPAPHTPQLWLVVAPQVLDRITLYQRQRQRLPGQHGGHWQVSHQGDQHAFALREAPVLNYALAVYPSATEPTVVYLRVRTQSPHMVSLQLQTPAQLQQSDAWAHAAVGLYVGMMLVMAGLALLHALTHRGDGLWAMNAGFQVFSIVSTLFYTGFVARYVWPHQPLWVDRGLSVLACVQALYTMLYHLRLARVLAAPAWLVRVLVALAWCVPPILLAVLAGYVRQAMFLHLLLAVLFCAVGAVGMFWCRIQDRVLYRLVVLMYVLLCGYTLALIVPVLAGLPLGTLQTYPVLLSGVVTAVMLFMVLKRRDWLARRQSEAVLAQAREDAIRAGFHHRMRLDAEAANRTLREANQKLTVLAHTDTLTGAYNRRYFQDCVTQELVRNERYATPMSLLIFDLDHFKVINDRHGHPAGDVVLVQTCQLLRGHLRASDLLARWGGEEFVVLLPHCDADTACALADKLRAVLADATFAEVGRVTASFGVAQYQAPESIEHWIGRADAALYQAKQAGRNTTRLAA